MAKSVYQKVIKPSDYRGSDMDKPNRAVAVAARRAEHVCLADQIAQNKTIVELNKNIPGLKAAFPNQPRMWYASKCFPFAVGGILFVDEPQQSYEIALCLEKAIALKKLNVRYIFVAPRMTIEEVVGQLES